MHPPDVALPWSAHTAWSQLCVCAGPPDIEPLVWQEANRLVESLVNGTYVCIGQPWLLAVQTERKKCALRRELRKGAVLWNLLHRVSY